MHILRERRMLHMCFAWVRYKLINRQLFLLSGTYCPFFSVFFSDRSITQTQTDVPRVSVQDFRRAVFSIGAKGPWVVGVIRRTY